MFRESDFVQVGEARLLRAPDNNAVHYMLWFRKSLQSRNTNCEAAQPQVNLWCCCVLPVSRGDVDFCIARSQASLDGLGALDSLPVWVRAANPVLAALRFSCG